MRQQHGSSKRRPNQNNWDAATALHLANSAATNQPALHYNMVRVGLAIYGLYPAAHLQSLINLKPALQVKARSLRSKTIQPQTGCGHQFIAEQELASPLSVLVTPMGTSQPL